MLNVTLTLKCRDILIFYSCVKDECNKNTLETTEIEGDRICYIRDFKVNKEGWKCLKYLKVKGMLDELFSCGAVYHTEAVHSNRSLIGNTICNPNGFHNRITKAIEIVDCTTNISLERHKYLVSQRYIKRPDETKIIESVTSMLKVDIGYNMAMFSLCTNESLFCSLPKDILHLIYELVWDMRLDEY